MKYHFYLPGCIDIYCMAFIAPRLDVPNSNGFFEFEYYVGDGIGSFCVHEDIIHKLNMEIVAYEDN